MSAAPSNTESREARRARLYQEEAKREEKRQSAIEDRKLDRLELVSALERETNGVEGQEFAILDTGVAGEGFFVVRRGASVLFKRYLDSKMNDADRFDFVLPHIPTDDAERFKDAVGKRPGIAIQLVNLLAGIYGVVTEADKGK